MKLKKIDKGELTKKFTEQANYYRLAARLIDYGLVSTWLANDDFGADFIAIDHKNNLNIYAIQLKSRITISLEYLEKNIYIAFPLKASEPRKNWVIVPHDELEKIVFSKSDSKFNSIFEYAEGKSKSKTWHTANVTDKILNDVIELSILDNPIDI